MEPPSVMCYVSNYVHKFHLSWPRVLKNGTLKTNVPYFIYFVHMHAVLQILNNFEGLHPYLVNSVYFCEAESLFGELQLL